MKISWARRLAVAFSLIELLCVIAIIAVLAALLLPALSQAHARAKRIECVSHLRQVGIAFQNFAQDHNGQFPMSVPVSAGGSLEFARGAYGVAGEFYFSFRHFQVLSNELVAPKLVTCPADTRPPAPSFAALSNGAVSYFVGISAVSASSDSILAGDRNLTNDWVRPTTLLHFGPNQSLRWTDELHQFKGNLLFADGRVEERNTPGLVAGARSTVVADLAMPTERSGGRGSLSGGLEAGLSSSTPQATASPASSAAIPAFNKQRPVTANSGPSNLNATRPGWGSGFAAGGSQPDLRLAMPGLQPGTSSNSAQDAPPQPQDPGFSLFPPLFGQGGLLSSKGSGWLLFALVMLLLLLTSIGVLKRVLGRRQPVRKGSRETLRLF